VVRIEWRLIVAEKLGRLASLEIKPLGELLNGYQPVKNDRFPGLDVDIELTKTLLPG
jgi:hypothetical protein